MKPDKNKLEIETLRGFKMEKLKGKEELANTTLYNMNHYLSELGLHCWVAAGTALGLVRDKGFIPQDKDIDFHVHLDIKNKKHNQEVETEIRRGMKQGGADLVRRVGYDGMPCQLCFQEANGILVDVHFYYEGFSEPALININEHGLTLLAKRLVEPSSYVEFQGEHYGVPHPVEEYLEQVYGKTWKIPDKERPNWEDQYQNLLRWKDV